MPGQFLVGDTGTWVTPEGTMDADLSDDRWFPYTPGASSSETTSGVPPASQEPPPQGDLPNMDDKPPSDVNRHEWAAQILANVWQQMFDTVPSAAELQAVEAIAKLESSYGWPNPDRFPEWQGHHNWGSVHCTIRQDGQTKSCMQDGGCIKGFLSTDKINGVPKPVCFASFPTNEEGAAYFLKTLLVRRPNVKAVIGSGDAYRIALEMRKTSYFLITQSSDPKVISADAAQYAGAIMGAAKTIAAARKTPLLMSMDVPSNTDAVTTKTPSWPRQVTDMAGFVKPNTGGAVLAPVTGILVGIGLGVVGIWGYKKWVRG